jgi:carbonic anhydrase/acetyltransferase-like protein (isoleucine patch superfamily)
MALYQLADDRPDLASSAFVAETACVIGRVRMEAESSVWFHAVLRGDTELITIGPCTNIQDGCVLHTDKGYPLTLGSCCTVGHNAIVHGCTIGDYTLIGMGATILTGAKIGKGCIIGAHALVKENMVIPDHTLVFGVPGKPVRTLDPASLADLEQSAHHYRDNAARFRKELKRLDDTP